MTPASNGRADPGPPVTVDIELCCGSAGVPPARFLRQWVTRAIEASGAGLPGAAEVAVRIVAPEEMRALNARYRGRDRSTNVLSFPAGRPAGLPADVPATLGDLVVCAEVVAAEAAAQGKPAAAHWAHMLVHGTLHLLGFDHERPDEAARMEGLEVSILGRHGIGDPYAAS